MLINRKDDPFLMHRYNVYLRNKLTNAMEHTMKSKMQTKKSERLKAEQATPCDDFIEEKIENLRSEVNEIVANGGHSQRTRF